ncbi:MAG: hypothetical protein M1838_000496 [Thelocarpon superellum]|nr:MAG: hypothetical protein M1838_000496 [Thelocarpon superellum]
MAVTEDFLVLNPSASSASPTPTSSSRPNDQDSIEEGEISSGDDLADADRPDTSPRHHKRPASPERRSPVLPGGNPYTNGHDPTHRTPASPRSFDHESVERHQPKRLKRSDHARSAPRPQDRSSLTPEIWQHVFPFVPPPDLATLLRVSSHFRAWLTPSRSTGAPHDTANAIWVASRRRFLPEMPKPLSGFTELDMWRLVGGKSCHFCGKRDLASAITAPYVSRPDHPWEPALGENRVRPIWPFRLRSCGSCLLERSDKEIDLLTSASIPFALLAALPFVFLTPQVHVITPTALSLAVTHATLQMTKHFLRDHIDDITQEFNEVKALGPASTEEWLKGLASRGKERIADASRWERWESSSGWTKVQVKMAKRSVERPPIATHGAPSSHLHDLSEPHASGRATPGDSIPTSTRPGSMASPRLLVDMTGESARTPSTLPPRDSSSPSQNGAPHPAHGSFKQPRVERSMREVTELKATRRAEIERRCQMLSPPIGPAVLNHMESFQNAMQISMPLTEGQWFVLRPLLVAQRDTAERIERERLAQSVLSQAKIEERRQQEASAREARELQDKEWEEAQQPIRERLGRLTDDIIRERWPRDRITKDSSPRFAADVLIEVRKRYYEEVTSRHGADPEGAGASRAPAHQRLILENMKWVFDQKLRPLTEQYRKELFLCHGCEHPAKFYGFEGVIQHFAAKHTNALSQGSIVVHWKAEWPEHSPFQPDPNLAKAAIYVGATPSHASGLGGPPHPHYASAKHGSFAQGAGASPHPAAAGGRNRYPPFSPGQYHPPAPANYSQGMLPMPNAYNGSLQGYYPSGSMYPYGPHGSVPGYEVYPGPYPPHGSPGFGSPYPAPAYPSPIPGRAPLNAAGYPPASQEYDRYAAVANYAAPGAGAAPLGMPGAPGGMYETQLEEMATIARGLWSSTSGIKNLSSSVRLQVIIHHTLSRFRSKFFNDPSLAMFMDGLATHPKMRPLNSFNGIACRACLRNGTGHGHPPRIPTGDRKVYTLPALLHHFRTVHVERAAPPRGTPAGYPSPMLDWKEDMVELPDRGVIAALLHAPGMDDDKLRLVAEVFHEAFQWPLPVIGSASTTGPIPGPPYRDSKTIDRPVADTREGPAPHAPPYRQTSMVPLSRSSSHREAPEPRRAATRDARRSQPSGHLYPSHEISAEGESHAPPSSRRYDAHGTRSADGGRPAHPDAPAFDGADSVARVPPSRAAARWAGGHADEHSRPSRARARGSPIPRHHDPRRPPARELVAAQEGSEDGEVRGDPSAEGAEHAHPASSPSEGLTAAERFLNSLQPGERPNTHPHPAHERQGERQGEREALRRSAPTHDLVDDHPGDGIAPDPTSPNHAGSHERLGLEHARRPRSRYGRYEHMRTDPAPVRDRSRSPPRATVARLEEGDFSARERERERASVPRPAGREPVYRARSPASVRPEQVTTEARPMYAQPMHEAYVTYADDRMAYVPEYEERGGYMPVRRVPAHAAPSHGGFLVNPPESREVLHAYPRFEADLPGGPAYDDRRRLIRIENPVYHPHDPHDHLPY